MRLSIFLLSGHSFPSVFMADQGLCFNVHDFLIPCFAVLSVLVLFHLSFYKSIIWHSDNHDW
jgi:hypothetical protein